MSLAQSQYEPFYPCRSRISCTDQSVGEPLQTTSDPSSASDAAVRPSTRVSMTTCASTSPNQPQVTCRVRVTIPLILSICFTPFPHAQQYKWAGAAMKVAKSTLDVESRNPG
jgi:hypothetical protein